MIESTADVYKQRLIDISWFMRLLNEPIARQANKEETAQGIFIHCHPWHLASGLASAIQFFQNRIIG